MASSAQAKGSVVALSGGIGGAKLALGLSRMLQGEDLTVIANTGDDFEHLGLHISPDLDTLMYTLAGLSDPVRGWGLQDETWHLMKALAALGGETWFSLGDKDLATHVERTRRLKAGESLTAITRDFCRRFGVTASVLPMSDDPVRTRLHTPAGWLDFQDYFVRQRSEPVISEIAFAGAGDSRAQPQALAALHDPRLRAVIICPSNPCISIEPILAVPGLRAALRDCTAPVVAVSPIIGGHAVKGPTAKMLGELGIEVSASAVAHRYADFLDGYVIDECEDLDAEALGLPVLRAPILMISIDDKVRLAETVLTFADSFAALPARARRA
jgi:LPPG:FO 2-phospho-L-lactate transferase